ncbi:MAG TPA: hypothetical protein DHN33_09890 [Eubacteriaceae bacterium]|nr:hypothetical protein [Eubacteriaceae bacterium]
MILFSVTGVLAHSEYKAGQKIEIGEYTGTIIDESDLPKGIQPIYIENIKEVEGVVKKLESGLFSVNDSKLIKSDMESKAYGYQTKRMSVVSGLYVKAYYTYASNPIRFGSCTNVVSYLSGQPFADWTQTSYSGSVIDSGRSLAVNFSGFLDVYITTPFGLLKVSTTHHDLYTEFYYTAI